MAEPKRQQLNFPKRGEKVTGETKGFLLLALQLLLGRQGESLQVVQEIGRTVKSRHFLTKGVCKKSGQWLHQNECNGEVNLKLEVKQFSPMKQMLVGSCRMKDHDEESCMHNSAKDIGNKVSSQLYTF
jgi:hypothetical protein